MTCLSLQVYDLVTKRDQVIQPVDYVDDQFTIDLTVVRQQFGAGTVGITWLHIGDYNLEVIRKPM